MDTGGNFHGAWSAREMEFPANERHTAFVIIKFAAAAVAVVVVGWKFL